MNTATERTEQEIVRRNALARLRELGINPYPAEEFVFSTNEKGK